ncbi:MAG TPA: hypothetical protein VNJ01_14180 [Bacteriovoracaceae bacterium]|nr:hypothetical protein [Bacteriovoracaceae bacterium]
MKVLLATLTGLFFMLGFASPEQAPPSFPHKEANAVFVNFKHAVHELTYDYISRTATVESDITFSSKEEGYPIFDLVSVPTEVLLDGLSVTVEEVADPDAQTLLRVVQQRIGQGEHRLQLRHTFSTNVVFNELGVASAFWLSDLNDRRYLEQYLPSNFEFDQYSRQINVNFVGFESLKHTIKTNGRVRKINRDRYEIAYPGFYTSSSLFFHVFPDKSPVSNVQFYYSSIDGRQLPVDIYSIVDINPFVSLTQILLRELEADYGPFPFDQILIYGTTLVKGGMEYSGATATGLLSLGHELFHSYNARGVMPANGNSGWMDEAMSRWRDNNYPLASVLGHQSAALAGHSVWARRTDGLSYAQGSAFLSLLGHRMNEKGLNLKSFLKDYYAKYMHSTVTTPMFEEEVSAAAGIDFSADFNRYVYGKYTPEVPASGSSKHIKVEDPHHPSMSKEALRKLTMPSSADP